MVKYKQKRKGAEIMCEFLSDNNKIVFASAITLWGTEAQINMVFEELGELQQALAKYTRGIVSSEKVAEEIADVWIMLEQLTNMFGLKQMVLEYRHNKMLRLLDRIQTDVAQLVVSHVEVGKGERDVGA